MDFSIGDKVIFQYNKHASTDNFTVGLMGRYLIENHIYTIKDLKDFYRFEPHIKFKEYSTWDYWYPLSCFRLAYIKEDTRRRYDLK